MFNRLRYVISEYSIEVVIVIFLLVFLAIFTIPMMLYAVPAGHVAVIWKRFEVVRTWTILPWPKDLTWSGLGIL